MKETTILRTIAGDVSGSIYEFHTTKSCSILIRVFTDDTVMTVAVADWILTGDELMPVMQDYSNRYPGAGYGGCFHKRLTEFDSFC